jgi:hypothetical protein
VARPLFRFGILFFFADEPKKRVPYCARCSRGGQRYCSRHIGGQPTLRKYVAAHARRPAFSTQQSALVAHSISNYGFEFRL